MANINKIKPGDVLYSISKYRMGNTRMMTLGVYECRVVSVDLEKQTALISWNGNAPQKYYEPQIKALKTAKPITVSGFFGKTRLATKAERLAMKEESEDANTRT
jgi:1,4-dihydroxy-2-naphthoyl-CoA synthase